MARPGKIKNLMSIVKDCLDNSRVIYTSHASERQVERDIIRPEVEYVLRNGRNEKRKDEFDEQYQTWNYAIRGRTTDKKELRIIISFDIDNMLIITAIEL